MDLLEPMPQINKYFVPTLSFPNDLLLDAKEGSAARCARIMQRLTRFPVMILRGGYELFTASYHYLRTQKIFWMPQVRQTPQRKEQVFSLYFKIFPFFFFKSKEYYYFFINKLAVGNLRYLCTPTYIAIFVVGNYNPLL